MFPWRLGQYGGAAFLVPYLFFVYVLGTTGLMGEFGFGRWGQKGPMGAYDKVLRARGRSFGRWLGAYPVLAAWGVLLFYGIVAGWVLHYVFASIGGGYIAADAAGAYFGRLAGQPRSILWAGLALALTTGVLVFGVSKGIERANKYIMPLLLGLFILLVIRSVTLPGAMEGIQYIFVPDWSFLLKPITWGMALGQAFFSVCLTGSGMLVFGSYLRRDADIPASALRTVTFDTLAALLTSLIVMPAVFAYGLDPAAGPPLLFITLPEIFRAMPGGQIFGFLFFASIFLATLTSLLNMKEVVVEGVIDQFQWSRGKGVVLVMLATLVCGLPLALNMNLFTRAVDLLTIYIVPAGAVMAAVLFFWVYGIENARREINVGAEKPVGRWWNPVAKYLFVGVSMLIVVLQVVVGIG